MGYLVDIQKVWKAIELWHDEIKTWPPGYSFLLDTLKAIPPADGWIPCSERKPETKLKSIGSDDVDVDEHGNIVGIGNYSHYESEPMLITGNHDETKGVFTATYGVWDYEDGIKETAWRDNAEQIIYYENVTAWKPLTEAYNPDTKEEA